MRKLRVEDSPFEELVGFHEEVQRLVKPQYINNKDVLDIGCGFGWCETVFLKRNPNKIVGIDPSEECITTARQLKDPRCTFKKGSAIDLPFKNNSFDTVMSWEVLEHIPKNTEDAMFSEIFRVLKPGGNAFMSTQYDSILSTPFDPAWYLVGHRHYSKKSIENFAKNAGFIVKKIYTKGSFFTILGTLNMYASKWIFRRNRFYNSFFSNKTRKEYSEDSGVVNVFFHLVKPKN